MSHHAAVSRGNAAAANHIKLSKSKAPISISGPAGVVPKSAAALRTEVDVAFNFERASAAFWACIRDAAKAAATVTDSKSVEVGASSPCVDVLCVHVTPG